MAIADLQASHDQSAEAEGGEAMTTQYRDMADALRRKVLEKYDSGEYYVVINDAIESALIAAHNDGVEAAEFGIHNHAHGSSRINTAAALTKIQSLRLTEGGKS